MHTTASVSLTSRQGHKRKMDANIQITGDRSIGLYSMWDTMCEYLCVETFRVCCWCPYGVSMASNHIRIKWVEWTLNTRTITNLLPREKRAVCMMHHLATIHHCHYCHKRQHRGVSPQGSAINTTVLNQLIVTCISERHFFNLSKTTGRYVTRGE